MRDVRDCELFPIGECQDFTIGVIYVLINAYQGVRGFCVLKSQHRWTVMRTGWMSLFTRMTIFPNGRRIWKMVLSLAILPSPWTVSSSTKFLNSFYPTSHDLCFPQLLSMIYLLGEDGN